MSKINVDGKEYDTEFMSDEAKSQLASVQFVDAELQRLNSCIAIMQTARVAYVRALKASLATGMNLGDDTLKLS